MHPYRTPAEPPDAEEAPASEEGLIGGALIVLGGVRVAAAAVAGEVFGAEPTLAAIACAIGAAVLLRRRGRRARVRARR